MTKIAPVPLLIGVLLWGAATALLLEDAWHAQRFDVATMATPILTAATVASACLAHLRFASWRLLGGAGFAALALLGSIVMSTGTLGRLAENKDGKEATVQATNRNYGFRIGDLTAAKAEQARECKSVGPKCAQWNARVDVLTKELSGIVVKSSDPKADAIARLATLLGQDGDRVKEIVVAFDPVVLPLFLEFGSIAFFAGAFHRNRQRTVTVVANPSPIVAQSWSREDALADFQQMKAIGAQHLLAARWGVDRSTASRWLRAWQDEGLIDRQRNGREKSALALPPPR